MVWLILFLLALIMFTYVYLRGEDLSHLDSQILPRPSGEPSEALAAVHESLKQMTGASSSLKGGARLRSLREMMDAMSSGREFESDITPLQQGQVRGEWVVAPGADARRRLLYIHGGAWLAGSPTSHRTITNRLSIVANAAVFSLDYRLLPENTRRQGIEDCHKAYQWLLTNGPEGPEELDFLAVAGDSAGGNLTLNVIAWARDKGLRAADAAIAFSPATDGTLTAPSIRGNLDTDPMLGPAFGMLTRIPLPLLWWSSWFSNRLWPSDPAVSPLRGDLSGLPPVLVQVSEAEMLFDDARRYVVKAQAAGSPVELQSWPHMVHVWQIFNPELPEANHAFENIAEFLAAVEGRHSVSAAA